MPAAAHRERELSRPDTVPGPDDSAQRWRPSFPRFSGSIARLVLLMVLALSLLSAVPALRPVLTSIRHIKPIWILLAIALELSSDVGFVVLFRLFFDHLTPRDARAVAWTEQASGALLPGGGAGGLAIGGWLMHTSGVPTDVIIRRSGGLFFLTTAVNSATLIISGLLLWAGVSGSHAFLLTGLPALAALAATAAVMALPHLLRSREHTPRWITGIGDGVSDAQQTTFHHPSWRLLGALAYLGCDMAVLWVALKGVGEPASVPALVLAYNIGYLANILPIRGGIGVLDAGLAGSLLLYGTPAAHIAAAVIVYHAVALWVPGLGGTLAYLGLRSRLASSAAKSPFADWEAPGEASLPIAAPPASSPIKRTGHHDHTSDSPHPDPIRMGDRADRRPAARPVPRTGRARAGAALSQALERNR